MKILFISGPVDYGGAGKIIKFVANYLVAKGWGIVIYSLRQKEKSLELDSRIKYIGKDGVLDKKYRLFHWRVDEILQIRDVVKNEKPDIVCSFVSDHVFMSRLATIGLQGFKFVGAERGDPYTLPAKWIKPVIWAYKKCDNAIFQLEKQGKFFGDKVMKRSYVIPNPYIPACTKPLFDGERNKTVVTAGRFEHQKGFDVLIKAFAKVYAKHSDFKLIIFGSGSLKDEYIKLSHELGIDGVIEFPGYVKDVAGAVRKEGIFVLPSRFEGIPNALIEALSTGIPTVSADCTPGGPDFLTEHGKRGLLVKVDDVDSTAKAINYLIEHPNEAKELGEKGAEVINFLKPELIAKQWQAAFSEILNKHRQ